MFIRKKGFYRGEYVFERLSKNAPILQKENKIQHNQRHRLWTDQSLLMPRTQQEARSHEQFTRQRQTQTDSHHANK